MGRYVNSKEITDSIAPLGPPASGAPPELLDLFSFLRAHAEALTTARVMVAGMPVRPKLPDRAERHIRIARPCPHRPCQRGEDEKDVSYKRGDALVRTSAGDRTERSRRILPKIAVGRQWRG